MNKDKKGDWLGQPSKIKSLEKKFRKEAMKHRLHLTPGPPRFVAMRITEEQDKLGTKEHATCRSGVGTLLYLTKHRMPDLCNAVRDLSKTLDKPAPIHLKEMYRINRYVLPTKRQRLRFATLLRNWLLTVTVIMQESKKQGEGFMVTLCILVEYLLCGEAKA